MRTIILLILTIVCFFNCEKQDGYSRALDVETLASNLDNVAKMRIYQSVSSIGISIRGGEHLRVLLTSDDGFKELRFKDFYPQEPSKLYLSSGELQRNQTLEEWHSLFKILKDNGVLSLIKQTWGTKYVISSSYVTSDKLDRLSIPNDLLSQSERKRLEEKGCKIRANFEMLSGDANNEELLEFLEKNRKTSDSIYSNGAYFMKTYSHAGFISIDFEADYCK